MTRRERNLWIAKAAQLGVILLVAAFVYAKLKSGFPFNCQAGGDASLASATRRTKRLIAIRYWAAFALSRSWMSEWAFGLRAKKGSGSKVSPRFHGASTI